MIKQRIHHFSRGMVIGLEVMGFLAVLLFAAWLFLIIRLSQGPLNVDFLTDRIEKEFNSRQTDYKLDVGSTTLTWGGSTEPFIFETKDVRVMGADNAPILIIPKIGVELSKRYLVFGRLVPRVINIYSPAVKIERSEDGKFTFNLNDPTATTTAPVGNQGAFISTFLSQMKSADMMSGVLAGLVQVEITNAAMLFDDKVLGVQLKSSDSDFVLTRRKSGLLVDATIDVDIADSKKTYLRASLYYSLQTNKPNGVLYFTALNPAQVASLNPRLEAFKDIDLPLKGSIAFEMDENLNLTYGRYVLGADAGTFNAMALYNKPIAVTSLYSQGRFDLRSKEALLEQLRINMDGAKLEAKGQITKREDRHEISLDATLLNMPVNNLKIYWPEKLAMDARAWVTGNLEEGTATKATLDLNMHAPQGDFSKVALDKVGGQIDFNGLTVHYFRPLMPVLKVNGKAIYDRQSFNLFMNTGDLGDMKVQESTIKMTGLDTQDHDTHAIADVNVKVAGSLKSALQILNGKPLEYPKKLDIDTSDVAGTAAIDMNFNFPLYNQLSLNEVKIDVGAKLQDVSLKNLVGTLPLSSAGMDIKVSSTAMTVKGQGLLGDISTKFSWLKNFNSKDPVQSKADAEMAIDNKVAVKLGLSDDFKLTGIIPATITYIEKPNNLSEMIFKGDVTQASFTVPYIDYQKELGAASSLQFKLGLKNEKPNQLTGLSFTAPNATISGKAEFVPSTGALKKLSLDKLKLADTNVAVDIENKQSEGYAIKITGPLINASKFFEGEAAINSDAKAAKPVTPITVSLAVDKILTGQNKLIEKVRLFMRRNGWSRIEQLQLDGFTGTRPLMIKYAPVGQGHSLRVEALNAGAALSALGITDTLRGGALLVNAVPNPNGGTRDLAGQMELKDFTAVKVPALGRILNAMSLSGINELLSGNGISFKKMRAEFVWTDRGQPKDQKNTRVITIRDGETSGASLGLTFEGNIDQWNNIYDLNGTIIPVSDLNKLVKNIPLVGNILTGGSNAVFAATYSVKGPTADPTVTVNPLAALAPGVLRKLFFE